jgi:hypothetical protein
MLLWLKETYPTLELGTYTHFADNIHYYERHFELSEQILTNGLSDNQYTMNIEQPLFTLEDNGIKYTEAGLSFISEVDAMSENENAKGKNYLEILSKYLNVKNASTVNQDNTEQSAS